MEKLTGVIQNYAWGSHDAIPTILGRAPGDEPVAEYWMGAHHSAPSVVAGRELNAMLSDDPSQLGEASVQQFGERLPYLLKLLAADAPLSLQAHPTRAQAEAGYARENEEGVDLKAPHRTYRDDWPKPEAIVALSVFDALCGFRDPVRTAALFRGLGPIDGMDTIVGPLEERRGEAALEEVFLDILSLDDDRRGIVNEVVARAAQHQDDEGEAGAFARTATDIDAHYPGDPGILAALLLNRVQLQPGEALFLEAGNMHAYLRGTGVEIMANSDNVLRGGLTPKHINVDELVRVVSFAPIDPQRVPTRELAPGILRYDTPAPEFNIYALSGGGAPLKVPAPEGARIVVIVQGSAELADGAATLPLAQGEAAFLRAGEAVTLTGVCQAYVAAPGV